MSQFPVLVLTLTWVVLGMSVMGWGLLGSRWILPTGLSSALVLRQALWIGLFAFAVTAMALDTALPLGGPVALWIAGLVVAVGLVSASVFIIGALRRTGIGVPFPWWVGFLLLPVVLLVYAGWALGQPSNYDLGLYHIGSIHYARDFPLIPGLVNLHERFGFNSSMWPLSAWLGSPVWMGNEFRIINGLLLALLLAEMVLRIVGSSHSRVLPGTVIMVIGSVLVLGVLAQYPGRLLASSAQDTAALILGLVALAYFSDAMSERDWWIRPEGRSALASSVVVATSGALMRPLAWILVAMFVAVALITAAVGRHVSLALRSLRPIALVVVIAGVVVAVRDYLLSGWLLYPASLVAFPVDWRYPDPSVSSNRITAWARAPFQDVDTTLASSSWVGSWLERLPTDWSIPTLGALLLLALVLWWRGRVGRAPWLWRGCLWALLPVLALVLAWFITAPDPRFAWAGIVALGLVPVGFLAQDIRLSRMLMGGVAALAALLVLATVRGSWAEWSLVPVDPPVAETIEGVLSDGTAVVMPTPGDQCWATHPLCRPQYESDAVELRGPSVGNGFRPMSSAS